MTHIESQRRRRRAKRQPQTPDLQQRPTIDSFRAQHLALGQREFVTEFGRTSIVYDEAESPLAWLARRRGRDGRALIDAHQLQAGERLTSGFHSGSSYAPYDIELDKSDFIGPRQWRRKPRHIYRNNDCCSPARASCARCCRSGILGFAARHLLLSQRSRRCRT